MSIEFYDGLESTEIRVRRGRDREADQEPDVCAVMDDSPYATGQAREYWANRRKRD